MTELRHRFRFGHWPDWYQYDGMRFCMACATKGRPSKPLRNAHWQPVGVRC